MEAKHKEMLTFALLGLTFLLVVLIAMNGKFLSLPASASTSGSSSSTTSATQNTQMGKKPASV